MTTAMGYNMKIVRGELTFCGGGDFSRSEGWAIFLLMPGTPLHAPSRENPGHMELLN